MEDPEKKEENLNQSDPNPAVQEPGKENKPASDTPKRDERIDQLTGQMRHYQTQLKTERQEREKDKEAFNLLSKQYNELDDVVDKIEDKVSANEAPDYETDPKAYVEWANQRTLNKIEKMVKPTLTPPVIQSPPAPRQDRQSPVQEQIQIGLHDNYAEIIKEVNEDIKKDPALENSFFDTPNPFKSAYDYGIRKRKLSKDMREGTLNQAYAEGGSPPAPPDNLSDTISEDEAYLIKMGASHGMTKEKWLKRRLIINKRKRG